MKRAKPESDEKPDPSDNSNAPDPDITVMTDAQLAQHVRPRMEYGGHEYMLADNDALELAGRMRAARLSNQEVVLPGGGLPDGSDPAAAPDLTDREAKNIYDGESRININYVAHVFPYSAHAAMYGPAMCSAFKLINQHTAVSAGHCHWKNGAWLPRKTMRFHAGSTSNPLPELPATCYDRMVPSCWASGESASCDYSVMRLHSNTAGCPFDGYNVGWIGAYGVAGCTSNINAMLSGYPGEEYPAGWVYPTLAYDQRLDGWTSCPDWYPDRVFYYNDSTGGQSGAPLMSYWSGSGYWVRAVNKGYWCDPFCSNQGRRITSDLITWLQANAGY